MRRVGKSVLQKTFPPFPNASATLAQQHFQNGIGLHSGGHDDARRKGRHTGPDTADVIANHDETASELPGGHRNAAPPGHAGGGNHTMPGQQQCFDEILFHFGIIHGLDDDVAPGKQCAGRRAIKSPLLKPQDDGRIQFPQDRAQRLHLRQSQMPGEKMLAVQIGQRHHIRVRNHEIPNTRPRQKDGTVGA